jgi:predicted HTH domain antitoxin
MTEKTMSARFDSELYKEIIQYARERGIPKTRALRELTKEGVEKWKLTKALSLYKDGKVTIWKASRIAGIPLSRMTEIASFEKIPIHFSEEDLKIDFKAVFGETV